ncbi:MAG: Inorganic triphosphatase YgiF, contains and domain [Frankiales bacterium]|nr:Inorganic triphosphatase YgiF, contains and domain [Frankiales bacterium]
MKVTREVETKLDVPDHFVVPTLTEVKGVDRVTVRTLRLHATYYDTDDLRLARTGTTLRYRTGEGRPRWTLKLGLPSSRVASGGLDREERDVEGPGTAVPAELLDLLTAPLRGASLRKVVELRTRRTSSLLHDAEGGELADVVDDQVEVVQGTAVVDSWRELEVEDRGGGPKVAAAVLTLLRKAGARNADQIPKAVRALGPRATEPPDLPMPRRVRRKDPAAELVCWSLATGLAALVQHDVAVRRGLDDAVHQLRVTCRRLRSDLRTFRTLLADERVEPLRGELAWLAGSFGAARDLEVLRERLRCTAEEDPLQPLDVTAVDVLLGGEEQVAVQAALGALRSERYLALLQLLHDVATAPVFAPRAADRCDDVLPALVDMAWRHLARRARRLRLTDPDTRWHRARILAKRARYAAESAEVALGKDVRKVVKAAMLVQERLGEHQDAAVAASRVLALADEHSDDHRLALTCGRLAERERAHVLVSRRAFFRSWERLRT